MTKSHKKLSLKEREKIYGLVKEGASIREIGRQLGRSHSTISNELRRNGMNKDTYLMSEAQVDRNLKASFKGRKSKLQKGKLPLKLVEEWIIKNKWSPEQVSGRLKIKYKKEKNKQVSHETIYKYIYALKDPLERETYIKSLRRRRKNRKARKFSDGRRGPVANLLPIHERPAEVDSREVPGHWEGDSMVGANHQSAIGTLVERSSRYTIIVQYGNDKSAENVAKAFIDAYQLIPKSLQKTLTYDRGSEMARHDLFTQSTGMPVYFADPGCPGQRGTNENTNGLIRQFFPKKTDFSKVSLEELKRVEDLLNERPRKILDYKTPREVLIGRKKGPEPPKIKHRPLSGEEVAATLSLG